VWTVEGSTLKEASLVELLINKCFKKKFISFCVGHVDTPLYTSP
jgi:hypothetical protein